MIISASRRTDIPAFYSDWFYNRVKDGFVLVRNPMNPHQISKIDIRPEVVDCIVFWTKNPKRFVNRLSLLDGYYYYFQYTITGYGRTLEPNVPNVEQAIAQFQSLSKTLGRKRVIWRYDPIILTDDHSLDFHADNFRRIAERLSSYTDKCVISFVDFYQKTKRNMKFFEYLEISHEQILDLSARLKNTGDDTGISLMSCAEAVDLEQLGVKHGSCIDDKLIQEISGYTLKVGKDKNQRAECGCRASIDIGAYNTCRHGCVYCYANANSEIVQRNYSEHDSNSPLLFGKIDNGDKVSERKVLSCREAQKTLFGR